MKLMIRATILSLLMLPVIVSGQAQSALPGAWEGTIQSEAGEVPLIVELRVQDGAVTGPILMNGAEQYMRDGKVVGDGVEFTSDRLLSTDRDVRYVWTGAFSGDAITFSVIAADREGPSRDFILKRQAR